MELLEFRAFFGEKIYDHRTSWYLRAGYNEASTEDPLLLSATLLYNRF